MFLKNQKGQSVIIFTVAIMLVIFIGLSVYSLGETLVAKTRFRNMADATAFTGATMQFNGIGSFTNIYDLNTIVSICYYLSYSALNLKEGATALNKVAPGFDPTATALLFTTDVVKMTGSVTMFQKRIDQIVITPTDPHVVTPQIFNVVQNYHTSNSIIFAKMVENQNLVKNNFTNFYSLTIPSEIIFNQGPIDPTTYRWKMRNINARPKYSRSKTFGNATIGYKDVSLMGGNINIMVADSPKMIFQNILPTSKSSKTGKIMAFSYSFSGSQSPGALIEEPIVTCFNKLVELNTINKTRATNMTNWAKSATATNIQLIKDNWALMLADYNGYLTFLTQNGYDDCFRIYESSYTNTPQYGGTSSMNILEIPAYQTICTSKGLDYTESDDAKTFYKTLTLKDIFGSVANFRTAVESSVTTLSVDRPNQSNVMSALLLQIYSLKSDHQNWNLPNMITEYIDEVHDTENPSDLDPFLQVFQKINNAINESYTEVYNLKTLIPTITFDFNTLKPPQAFWDLVPKFFETPIIQLEGT